MNILGTEEKTTETRVAGPNNRRERGTAQGDKEEGGQNAVVVKTEVWLGEKYKSNRADGISVKIIDE